VSPRQPALNPKCPTDWESLVNEWDSLSLFSFVGNNQKLWTGNDVRFRFNKRKFALEEVERRRGVRTNLTLLQVARELEEERSQLRLTLTNHYNLLRSANPAVAQRQRVERAQNVPAIRRQQPPQRHQQQRRHQQHRRQLPQQQRAARPNNQRQIMEIRRRRRISTMTVEQPGGYAGVGGRGLELAARANDNTRIREREQRTTAFIRNLGNPMDILEDENIDNLLRLRNGGNN
jgi:hypothetical protein